MSHDASLPSDGSLTPRLELEIRITALLMGQLAPAEAEEMRARIAADPELAALYEKLRHAVDLLREARTLPEGAGPETPLQLSKERREKLLATFRGIKPLASPAVAPAPKPAPARRRDWSWPISIGLAASIVAVVGGAVMQYGTKYGKAEAARGIAALEQRIEVPSVMYDAPASSPADHVMGYADARFRNEYAAYDRGGDRREDAQTPPEKSDAPLAWASHPGAPRVHSADGIASYQLKGSGPLGGDAVSSVEVKGMASGVYLPTTEAKNASGATAVSSAPERPALPVETAPSSVASRVTVANSSSGSSAGQEDFIEKRLKEAPMNDRLAVANPTPATGTAVQPSLGEKAAGASAEYFADVNGPGVSLPRMEAKGEAPRDATGRGIVAANGLANAPDMDDNSLDGESKVRKLAELKTEESIVAAKKRESGDDAVSPPSAPASGRFVATASSAGRNFATVDPFRVSGGEGQAKMDAAAAGYDAARSQAMFEVTKEWERPYRRFGDTEAPAQPGFEPPQIPQSFGNEAFGITLAGGERREISQLGDGTERFWYDAKGQGIPIVKTDTPSTPLGLSEPFSTAGKVNVDRPITSFAGVTQRADEVGQGVRELQDLSKGGAKDEKQKGNVSGPAPVALATATESLSERKAEEGVKQVQSLDAAVKQMEGFPDAGLMIADYEYQRFPVTRGLDLKDGKAYDVTDPQMDGAKTPDLAGLVVGGGIDAIAATPGGPKTTSDEQSVVRALRTKAALESAETASLDKAKGAKQDGKEVTKLAIEDSTEPVKAPAAAPVPQPEVSTKENAFSTFSLNVSDVSFKLASASLEKGAMPDVSTVRTEEFINALNYRDPEPVAGVPLAFASERARYPFEHNRDLLRLSVKTAAAGREPGRPLNLVLLLDNSGSMERADRVRILKESLRVLTAQLKPQDKLSIITFSRAPRLWADGVSADKAAEFTQRVGEITPQGGTDLSAAMDLGYQTALKHYGVGSVNRVVLLTDGAANLGNVKAEALKEKVETHRKQGVAFDCFGVGWEGYNDDLLEQLSRNGDGRYGFINTPEAAATEFAGQLAGALRVAASDVKVQVEFNPRRVTAYRQLGYAKHQLKKEQFRDNTVDAAEIGAAESGNALYAIEVNPRGEGEVATVRVRFKVPGTADYREHEWTVPFTAPATPLEQASSSLRLAGSAAAFSEWLVQSPFAAEVSPDRLLGLLNGIPAIYGADPRPAKLEWMIRQAKSISGR